MFRAYLKCKD